MMALTLEEQDEQIRAMEEKFGGKWEELCIEIINVPAAQALDLMWRDIILSKDPNYGDWEYPGQAYRHLIAEYRELKAFYDAAMKHLTTTTFLMVKSAAAEPQPTNPTVRSEP